MNFQNHLRLLIQSMTHAQVTKGSATYDPEYADKTKATKKAFNGAYNGSDAGKAAKKAYNGSDAGKAAKKAYNASDAGKATRQAARQKRQKAFMDARISLLDPTLRGKIYEREVAREFAEKIVFRTKFNEFKGKTPYQVRIKTVCVYPYSSN